MREWTQDNYDFFWNLAVQTPDSQLKERSGSCHSQKAMHEVILSLQIGAAITAYILMGTLLKLRALHISQTFSLSGD